MVNGVWFMGFYKDMEKSLLEAIEIEKNNIPLKERENMPAPTYYIQDDDKSGTRVSQDEKRKVNF